MHHPTVIFAEVCILVQGDSRLRECKYMMARMSLAQEHVGCKMFCRKSEEYAAILCTYECTTRLCVLTRHDKNQHALDSEGLTHMLVHENCSLWEF